MSNEELVKLIKHGKDTTMYMEQLYIQNKGLIFAVVKKYRYACQAEYGSTPIIEIDELMNEAYFGLVKAVESYDASKGVLFMTYATSWIRQAVKQFLNNCGSVVRVPIHIQERVYRYNQVTSHYLAKYNRNPTVYEYGVCLGVSEKVIEQLRVFMFRSNIKSLEETIKSEENDNVIMSDILSSDVNIEDDIVEKVGNEQLHIQLWEIVGQVLKDDKKVQILKNRYIDNLTLDEIAIKYKVSKPNIDQVIRQSLRRLSCNTKTRRLGIEMGFWNVDRPINIDRVKKWINKGFINWLNNKEFNYALRMGWIKEDRKGSSR